VLDRPREWGGHIMTVLGPVPRESMGLTLPHEHLLIEHQGPMVDLTDVTTSIEEMERAARLGCRTVFEMSTIGLGRDPLALCRIAREVPMNVVMGTGFYKEGWLAPDIRSMSVDEMAAAMVRELVSGVGDTGIRAGVMGEIGCSRPTRRTEERVLAACARAQRATGAVVSVHFDIGGPDDERRHAVDILESEGADLGRVVVEHFTCRPDEMEICTELANRGCWIEFDLWGMELWPKIADLFGCPPEVQIASLRWFIAAGLIDQIMISQDVANVVNQRKYGGYGQSHILRNLLPRFREEGISESQLATIMVDNPGRLFPYP
jgi:phosphotriesterase-related protein